MIIFSIDVDVLCEEDLRFDSLTSTQSNDNDVFLTKCY